MNSELKYIIERIDQLRTEVDSYRPLKPEQEQRLLQKIRLDWNFHSNHIEGNSLTYSETKSFLLWHITADGKPFRDYLEMKGHNEAVEYLLDVLKGTDIDLTEHLIRHLHQTILHDEFEADAVTSDGKPTKRIIKPGQYKSVPNHVKTKSGAMFYFATPEDTPSQMSDLMAWYNKEMVENKSHPLIIASLFHYKFVRIHPFDDGNGRMARLLMNLILMKFGYPPVIVPFGIKDDYYNALQFADAEDFDKFIVFIGERLIEALNLVLKVGKNKPIEEADDVDKMVKMLEKKISGIDEGKFIKRDQSILKNVYKNSIKSFLISMVNTLQKFDVFFEEHIFIYKRNDFISKEIKIMFEDIENNFYKDETKEIEIHYHYSYIKPNLIIKAFTPFQMKIELRPETYILHFIIPNLKFEKKYNSNLTENEINHINYEIAKFINENIEKEISKNR